MAQQDNEPVSKYAVPTKIQQVTCATYPTPPPSPDDWNNGDNHEDPDLPFVDIRTKWEDNNVDSYSSHCPKDKKYS